MSEWKWIWWNLGHGPTDKDYLIRELRRQLKAVKERELELRRGEWVMKYFDAADEIERLREERLQWFVVARQLRDALIGAEEKDAAFDEYLRTRGRLEDPREQAKG